MQNTLPNEPLQIVITEAGSENLLFRSLLRQAMISLICGDKEQRKELADNIALLLDEVTPEDPETARCIGCGGYLDACYCNIYPTAEQHNEMQAQSEADWLAEFGYTRTAEEMDAEPTLSERIGESIKDDRF